MRVWKRNMFEFLSGRWAGPPSKAQGTEVGAGKEGWRDDEAVGSAWRILNIGSVWKFQNIKATSFGVVQSMNSPRAAGRHQKCKITQTLAASLLFPNGFAGRWTVRLQNVSGPNTPLALGMYIISGSLKNGWSSWSFVWYSDTRLGIWDSLSSQ